MQMTQVESQVLTPTARLKLSPTRSGQAGHVKVTPARQQGRVLRLTFGVTATQMGTTGTHAENEAIHAGRVAVTQQGAEVGQMTIARRT